MSAPGFVAIYRWTVDPAEVAAFRGWWAQGTEASLGQGSFGSLLAEQAPGVFVGIALWPSAAARARGFAALSGPRAPAPGVTAFAELAAADVLDNRWT